jgi:hypothetical protein
MPKRSALEGKQFGKLTVIRKIDKRRDNYQMWECRCACGNIFETDTRRLVRGIDTSCGCEQKQHPAKRGQIAENLTGQKFGRLTAIRPGGKKGGRTAWLCRCECGNECTVSSSNLKSGAVKSCGCLKEEYEHRYKDISGMRFGRLTAIEPTGKRDYKGSILWKCRCDCGNYTEASQDGLVQGNYVSCGCRKKEIMDQIGSTLTFTEGTCVEWLKNRKHRNDNTSGFRGVNLKPDGTYRAGIGFKGKRYYLGSFETYDDAVNMRLEAENMIHDGFIAARERWEQNNSGEPLLFEVRKNEGSLEIVSSDPECDGEMLFIGTLSRAKRKKKE